MVAYAVAVCVPLVRVVDVGTVVALVEDICGERVWPSLAKALSACHWV